MIGAWFFIAEADGIGNSASLSIKGTVEEKGEEKKERNEARRNDRLIWTDAKV